MVSKHPLLHKSNFMAGISICCGPAGDLLTVLCLLLSRRDPRSRRSHCLEQGCQG